MSAVITEDQRDITRIAAGVLSECLRQQRGVTAIQIEGVEEDRFVVTVEWSDRRGTDGYKLVAPDSDALSDHEVLDLGRIWGETVAHSVLGASNE